jgi:hypothetical protein
MPPITPLTPERHANKRWKRYSSYAFARNRSVTPLVGAELASAALTLPIVFMQQGKTWFPVALMGLAPDSNLLVGPDGRWLGGYVPASLRGYPFQLARGQDRQWILCVDESSGLLADGPEGEALFDADNKLTKAVGEVLEFLGQTANNGEATQKACAALARNNCIQSQPISLKTHSGTKQLVGLHQLDENALTKLDDEAFLELRRLGALPIAYFHLQSLQHLPKLSLVAETHAKAILPVQNGNLDLSFLNRDSTLKFDHF